jgi:multidrug efflux pump subunit AcrA (membrane-fusion protein)
MSCSVEILIEELPEVLHVPAQAVFRNLDRVYCYVVRGDSFEPREVRVGRFDELWVQILDGLGEGESVLLETPIGATPAESAPRSPDR